MTDPALYSTYKAFELSAWQRAASKYAESFERIAGPFAEDLMRQSECEGGHASWLAQGTARASALIRSQPLEQMSAVEAVLQESMLRFEHQGRFLIPAVAILATGVRTSDASAA
jgi:hypothetical protein